MLQQEWQINMQKFLSGYKILLESYYNHPKFTQDPHQLRFELEIRYENILFSFLKDNTVHLKEIIQFYEQNYPNKSNSGVIFTPPAIAQSMSELVIDTWIRKYCTGNSIKIQDDLFQTKKSLYGNIEHLGENFLCVLYSLILPFCTILDPCVGSGEFIIGCLNYLLLFIDRCNLVFETSSKTTNEKSIRYQSKYAFIKEFLLNNFQLIDLNPLGLELAQLRIWDLLLTKYPSKSWGNLFTCICSSLCHDFLDLPSSFSKKFEIIIGNPPYLSSDSMSKIFSHAYIIQLKNKFSSIIKSGSKPDLYFYFIGKAFELLTKSGTLSFIIPNRILTNDYAIKLRQYLFANANFHCLINFNPNVHVFPSINVHPCIFILVKTDSTEPNSKNNVNYYVTEIQNIENIFTFSLQDYDYRRIPQSLAQKYNLLFTSLSNSEFNLLLALNDKIVLKNHVKIHEAKRLAHFEKAISKDYPIRIDTAEFLKISPDIQSNYVREIRGKEIQENSLEKSHSYIQIPPSYHKYYPNEHVLYIRELGDKIYCGIDWDHSIASMGYGGVYYIYRKDIVTSSITSYLDLLALESFLSSNVTTKIYRILFQAGSWGTALKIRSSYLHQLPCWIPDSGVFAEFACWMEFLQHVLKYNKKNHSDPSRVLPINGDTLLITYSKLKNLVDWLLYEVLIPKDKLQKVTSESLLEYWIGTSNSDSISKNFIILFEQTEKCINLLFDEINVDNFAKIRILANMILENLLYRIELFENNSQALTLSKLIQAQISIHFL